MVNDSSGLNLFLAVIVSLAILGLIVFIFVATLSEIKDTVATESTGANSNETLLFTNGTGTATSVNTYDGIELSNVEVIICE